VIARTTPPTGIPSDWWRRGGGSIAPRSIERDIVVVAHPDGHSTPAVSVGVIEAGGLPSTVDLPTPGCWWFDLSMGTEHGTIGLVVGM